MKRIAAVVISSLLFCAFSAGAPRTLRVDYYHTGNAHEEWFSLDRVVLEPLEWPGNPHHAIDETHLGNYMFEVRERSSGKLLYSRGFNSVFGEWKTTEEALHANRTFSESLRFPGPETPVEVSLKERAGDDFREVWKAVVDPRDQFVDRSRHPSPGPLMELQRMGDPAGKVDLLVLGDGYTAAERGKFEKDARRFMELLFAASPFREHRSEFNVWGLCPVAEESGVSRPSSGIYRRSPVGASYDTFGTERYILTTENRALRDVASFAPNEFIEILVNGETYGGGGIFNQFATGDITAADVLTTLVDLYGLPAQFPGHEETKARGLAGAEKAAHIESAWKTDMKHPNFYPYIQVHEFEALILTRPSTLSEFYPEHAAGVEQLRKECASFHTPEDINEVKATSPSHRILARIPTYRKIDGFRHLQEIGLPELKAHCPRFKAWVEQCERCFR